MLRRFLYFGPCVAFLGLWLFNYLLHPFDLSLFDDPHSVDLFLLHRLHSVYSSLFKRLHFVDSSLTTHLIMKTQWVYQTVLLAFVSLLASAKPKVLDLSEVKWTLTSPNFTNISIPAKFPSQAHLDLYSAKV